MHLTTAKLFSCFQIHPSYSAQLKREMRVQNVHKMGWTLFVSIVQVWLPIVEENKDARGGFFVGVVADVSTAQSTHVCNLWPRACFCQMGTWGAFVSELQKTPCNFNVGLLAGHFLLDLELTFFF